MTTILEMVHQLAVKHGFTFRKGESLWIAGKGNHGPLIIAVSNDGKHYVIARTYYFNLKEYTGFRVYFDTDWQPIAAVGDDGSVVKDLNGAVDVLDQLVRMVYMDSDVSSIRIGEYPF